VNVERISFRVDGFFEDKFNRVDTADAVAEVDAVCVNQIVER